MYRYVYLLELLAFFNESDDIMDGIMFVLFCLGTHNLFLIVTI